MPIKFYLRGYPWTMVSGLLEFDLNWIKQLLIMNELQHTKYGKCIQAPCKTFHIWATLYSETYTIFHSKYKLCLQLLKLVYLCAKIYKWKQNLLNWTTKFFQVSNKMILNFICLYETRQIYYKFVFPCSERKKG